MIDADPDCPDCHGQGFTVTLTPVDKGPSKRKHTQCACVMSRELVANLARIWNDIPPDKPKNFVSALQRVRLPDDVEPVLTGGTEVERNDGDGGTYMEFVPYTKQSCWITGQSATFRAHLRAASGDMGPQWFARRWTDADLIGAWLNTAISEGVNVRDPDALASYTINIPRSLGDLAVPPTLLIIEVGVKIAANVEAKRVLDEAIRARASLGKATWIWDQTQNPWNETMLSFSPQAADFIHENEWPRISLERIGFASAEAVTGKKKTRTAVLPGGRRSLSSGKGGTKAAKPRPPAEDKKKYRGRK